MNAGPQRQNMRQSARPDHRLIAELVEPGSRLLDIGCGDGALLELLAREKNVDGRGIEISQEGVNASVRRGLSVIQGDAETDLAGLSGCRLRLRGAEPDPARDPPIPRASCWSCAGSAGARSCLSPTSGIGVIGCTS